MNLQMFGLLLNAPSYLDRYFCFLSLHCSMDRQAAWIQLRGTAQHYSFNGLLLRLPFFVTYTGSPSHISHLFPFLFVILYMYAHNAPLAHYPRPVPLSSESFEPTTFGHGSSEQEVSKLQDLNPPFGHRGFDKPRTHPVSSPAPPSTSPPLLSQHTDPLFPPSPRVKPPFPLQPQDETPSIPIDQHSTLLVDHSCQPRYLGFELEREALHLGVLNTSGECWVF